MSVFPEKLPLVGAIEINPLTICSKNHATTDTAKKMDETGSADDNLNNSALVDILKCARKDEVHSGKTLDNTQKISRQKLKMSHSTPSVPSFLHNYDTLTASVSLRNEAGLPCSKPIGAAMRTSDLMMKLSITGPPKYRVDQKRTVLPTSLLEGVTELVKQQAKLSNYTNASVNNNEKLISTKNSSGFVYEPAVLDLKDKFYTGTVENRALSVNEANAVGEEISLVDGSVNMQRNRKNVSFPDNHCEDYTIVPFNISEDACELKNSTHVCSKVKKLAGAKYMNIFNHVETIESISSKCLEEKNNPKITAYHIDVNESDSVEHSIEELNRKVYTAETRNSTDFVHPLGAERSNKDHDAVVAEKLIRITHTEEISKLDNSEHSAAANEVISLAHAFKTEKSNTRAQEVESGELERKRKRELKKRKKNGKQWEKFSKKKIKSNSVETEEKTDSREEGENFKKPVPNYFVAIQITDPEIKNGLKTVQDKVVSESKNLAPALNKVSTLHLTLMVLSLKTDNDMEKARQALDKASVKLLLQFPETLQLDISGLGHFRNSVVFAKVKTEDQVSSLKNIAAIVEECFLDKEIVSPDQRGFKPHVTIMKLSSVKGSKKKGLKKIPEVFYSDFLDTDFGFENTSRLQLCSMHKPKDRLGYYQVEHEVQFSLQPETETYPSVPKDYSDQQIEVAEESSLQSSLISSAVEEVEDDTGNANELRKVEVIDGLRDGINYETAKSKTVENNSSDLERKSNDLSPTETASV